MSKGVNKYKRTAIKTARDLQYPENTIKALQNATTDGEISRIMLHARRSIK